MIGGFYQYISKDNFLKTCAEYRANEVSWGLSNGEWDKYIRKDNEELVSVINRQGAIWISDGWNQKKNSCYRRLFVLEISGRGLRVGKWFKYYRIQDSASC